MTVGQPVGQFVGQSVAQSVGHSVAQVDRNKRMGNFDRYLPYHFSRQIGTKREKLRVPKNWLPVAHLPQRELSRYKRQVIS